MAKFCGVCGNALGESDKVCGTCGTPVPGMERTNPVNPHVAGVKKDPVTISPEDVAKIKKLAKRVIALVVLVAVIAVSGIVAFNNTGSRGLVKKVMTAYKNYEINDLIEMSSDVYYYSYYEDYLDDYYKSVVGRTIDSIEDKVGHHPKISYKIEEIYDMTQRKSSELLDSLSEDYKDFDVDTIKKIKVAVLEIQAKGKGKKDPFRKRIELVMTQEGKDWKLLYIK